MTTREQLLKISEKAKLKSLYKEDIKRFAQFITTDWLRKSTHAANECQKKLILAAFSAGFKYEGTTVKYMFKNGLIDLIQEIVGDLTVNVRHFLYDKDKKTMHQITNPHFDDLLDKQIIHIIIIQLRWD